MEGRQLRLFELAPEQWLRSKIDICSKSQRWPRYRQISCPDRPEYVEGRAGKQGGIAGYVAIRPIMVCFLSMFPRIHSPIREPATTAYVEIHSTPPERLAWRCKAGTVVLHNGFTELRPRVM